MPGTLLTDHEIQAKDQETPAQLLGPLYTTEPAVPAAT
jgi:hypothetical protein